MRPPLTFSVDLWGRPWLQRLYFFAAEVAEYSHDSRRLALNF